MTGPDQRAFRLSIIGQLLLQPLQFHLESPDLLVELGVEGFLFPLLPSGVGARDTRSFVEQFLFPCADLAGMKSELAG